MQLRLAALCCACAAFWWSPASAQQHANANPADPRAAVPPVRYQSAFIGYQPLRDEKPASWRDVNDEVARAGGHLGIFRNSVPGAAPAASGGHAGHAPGAAR